MLETELQNSTFICALNILLNNGQYGTIHRLSTVNLFPRNWISNVLPPSSSLLLLQFG